MAEYHDLLYDDHAFIEAHPARVLALGVLFGLNPDRDRPLRVLDVGCALGGHLLPLAEQLPAVELVGIDLSEPQIELARADASRCGIAADLRAVDVRDVPAEIGRFDVIVCHGVWSWVPEDARAAIFRLFRRHLAPEGVAYVSYNTFPGWCARGVLRQVLKRVVQPGSDLEMATQARDALRVWRAALGDTQDPIERGLAAELDANLEQSDAYLRYEHLAEINHPAWFSDVLPQTAAAGLQYLCDAVPSSHLPFSDPEVEAWIRARTQDFAEVDALRDQFSNRLFRRDLYVHRERYLDRDPSWRRLEGLVLASRLHEDHDRSTDEERVFSHRTGGTIRTNEPQLIQVLRVLQSRWPNGLSFADLSAAVLGPGASVRDRAGLGTVLFEGISNGVIEVWTHLPAMATTEDLADGARPRAPVYSRLQAGRGDAAVNLRHERMMLSRGERCLLQHLDGTRDIEALRALFRADAEAGRFNIEVDGVPSSEPEVMREAFDAVIRRLYKAALIYAPAG